MSETNACPIGELANILLATDGSKESDKALGEALVFPRFCRHLVTLIWCPIGVHLKSHSVITGHTQ
jgi:nucleotide-binding universal stress UspA family protein